MAQSGACMIQSNRFLLFGFTMWGQIKFQDMWYRTFPAHTIPPDGHESAI